MRKVVIISKTRWFSLSPAKVRVCLHCRKPFISTCRGERQCKECFKAEKGARERAAITPETTLLREFVDSNFDITPWLKGRWIHYYEQRRRAMINERLHIGVKTDIKHAEAMMRQFL